jgi:t-SNARE complex subunit (syntaxin)
LDEKARLIAKQKQAQRELNFEREMMLERERRIKQIEEDVLDVNEIMRELGTMVHDQGEVVGEFFCHLRFFKLKSSQQLHFMQF